MPSIHAKAFLIAAVHYAVSFVVAFFAFAAAWGSGLSDAYHGDPNLDLFAIGLAILQAPVALIQWIVIHFSADGRIGLQPRSLIFLAMPSSLIYGYVITFLSRRFKKDHNNIA